VIYVDDRLPRHPKIFRAGERLGTNGPAQALALFIAGLAYAREHLTDGFIPYEFVSSCGLVQTPQSVAGVLCSRTVRLWHRTRGGYLIHDYGDWNLKASEIKRKREKERIKKAAQRALQTVRAVELSRDVSPRDSQGDSRARGTTTTTSTSTTTTDVASTNKPDPIVSGIKSTAAARRFSLTENTNPKPLPDLGTFGLYCVVMHEAIDHAWEADADDSYANVAAHFKSYCALRMLTYSGEICRKAYDAVIAARMHQALRRATGQP
jgi:hypothetical protein